MNVVDQIKALERASQEKKIRIILQDDAGNVVNDISLSSLRDALKGANNKDFSTLEADVESILAQLDIPLSAHRDALKPTRTTPTQVLSAQIPASNKAEFVISNGDGYSAVVVTVKAAYDASATAGVRVRWLYSPDGTNFDSVEDAEAEGNYVDLSFEAGATRQRTILIPIFADNVKVQIVNLDATYSVTVDVWSSLLR